MMSHALPKGSATRLAYLGLFGLFLLVLLVWSKTGAQVASSSPLIALYPMSGTDTVLSDTSGNNLDGTLTNFSNPTFGSGPIQNTNSLVFTNNAIASVDLSHSTASFSTFTFATIFQSTATLSNGVPLATGTDTAGDSWVVQMGTNGQPTVTLTDPKGNQQVVTGSNAISLLDGNWHSIILTLNSTTARLYTDNIATESAIKWSAGSSKQLSLGSVQDAPFKFGQTVLLGTALDASQVSALGLTSPSTAANLTPIAFSSNSSGSKTTSSATSASGNAQSAQSAGIHPLVSGNLFTIVAGNNQIVPVSTFATNSLQVKLTNSSGTAIPNYPIAFALQTGSDGGFSTTSGGTTSSTLTINTNSSGIATIYYESSTDLLKNNLITATDTTDSLVVTFTEHCGTQTGLVTWFAADQVNGTGNAEPSNGASIGTWTELEQSNNVTQGTTSYQPTFVASDINSKPAVHYNGSQSLTSSVSLGSSIDGALTIFAVGSTTSPSAYQSSVWLGTIALRSGRGTGYYNGAEYFDTDGSTASGTSAPNANTPTIEGATLDSTLTQATLYQNGSVTTTATLSGLQNVNPGFGIGCIPGQATGWQGNLQEVLVYNHVVTSTELAAINQYLGDKYGIYTPNATWYTQGVYAPYASEIQRNHWNTTQATAYIALQSNSSGVVTTGLLTWFSADQLNGTGNSLPNNGAAVSSWTDLAEGNNVTATGATPVFVATDIDSKPSVSFSGQYLSNPINMGSSLNADMSIVAVASTTTSGSAAEESIEIGAAVRATNRNLGYYTSQETLDFNQVNCFGGPVPNANTFTEETVTVNSAVTQANFYQNGAASPNSPVSISGALNVSAGITISPSGAYWSGNIQEVLVYDHQLTSTEQNQLNQYLGDKYGFYTPTATWFTQGAFAPYSAEIQRNHWNKTQANTYIALQSNTSGVVTHGLIGWYHADTITGVSNGSSVSSWTDSAMGNTVTQSSSTYEPTYVSAANETTGQPALRFNGTEGLTNPNQITGSTSQDMTIIGIGSSSNTSAVGYIAVLGQPGLNVRGLCYSESLQDFPVNAYSPLGGPVPSANTFTQQTGSLDSTGRIVTFYQNGSQTATDTLPAAAALPLAAGICVGYNGYNGIPSNWQGWQGDLSEVLVYDHQLTSTEMAQVSTYLAVKYNLPLPPTLPAPTISPASGSYSSPLSVTITPYSSSFAVHYTLDGTTPTINSPLYSGPISLTSSAYVAAIAYANSGADSSAVVGTQYYVNDSGQTGLPKPPTALTTTLISSSEIDLAWTLPTGAVTYQTVEVYRSVNGGAYELFAILPVTSTTFKDTTVSAGNSYSYSVGTFNEDGIASTSNSTGITPTAPTAISITVTTPSGAINLP